MIDEKRLAELRYLIDKKISLESFPVVEILDTIEILLLEVAGLRRRMDSLRFSDRHVFTPKQLDVAMKQSRRKALEEAAKISETSDEGWRAAEAIRSLKDAT